MKLLSLFIKDDQYRFLKQQKKDVGIPFAETVRRALDKVIPESFIMEDKQEARIHERLNPERKKS